MIELRRLVLIVCLVTILTAGLPIGSAHAAHQTDVLKRAQSWTKKRVKYSQKRRYLGYRADCSGFVSYALGLGRPGATTRTLGNVTVSVKKRDLLPGDIILAKGKHVVMFGGWANKAKTKYIAYEQSAKSGGVKRVLPYPYYSKSGKWAARRYVKIVFALPKTKNNLAANIKAAGVLAPTPTPTQYGLVVTPAPVQNAIASVQGKSDPDIALVNSASSSSGATKAAAGISTTQSKEATATPSTVE